MVTKLILHTSLNFIHYLANGDLLNSDKICLHPPNFYCYYLCMINWPKLTVCHCCTVSLYWMLLSSTHPHPHPFCALNFTFAWQAVIVYFLLCRTLTTNVQLILFFANNFGLYINSQRKKSTSYMYRYFAVAMTYLSAIGNACTRCKQQHVKFSHRLAKEVQTMQKSTQLATLSRCTMSPHCNMQRDVISSWNHLHFCKFFINPNFDLKTNYIFRKLTNRHFQWYTGRMGNLNKFSHINQIHFSAGEAVANPIFTNQHQKPPKPPPSPWGMWTPI